MDKEINYLIVEDDLSCILIVKYELISAGFKVNYKFTDNKKEVVELLQSFKFDVIISDHQMPSLSSLDVLKARNSIAPDTPFIILSMEASSELRKKASLLGCNSIISKSDINKLPSLIEACVTFAERRC